MEKSSAVTLVKYHLITMSLPSTIGLNLCKMSLAHIQGTKKIDAFTAHCFHPDNVADRTTILECTFI